MLARPVNSKELGGRASSTVGGGEAARGAAPGDDKIKVVGDSMSWSRGPSGSAIARADAGVMEAPRPSMKAWAAMAPARVNGASSGREEYLSVVARSVVGQEELIEPLSWVGGVGMSGRSMRGHGPCGSLNHSSFISGIPVRLACDSHIEPSIISVENEGSAYTTIRSRHGPGGEDSRTPSALINKV